MTIILSAKLNVVISQISMVANAIGLLPVVLRLTLGPLPHLAVFTYYLYRINFTFMITLLTFNTILKTSFILDFNRMSGMAIVLFLIEESILIRPKPSVGF